MVWIIAGTKGSQILIQKLLDENFKILATYTAQFDETSMFTHKNLTVNNDLNPTNDLKNIFYDHKVDLIIDSTHPFDEDYSRSVMRFAQRNKIPFIRYEQNIIVDRTKKVFRKYSDAVNSLKDCEGNILLNINIDHILYFSSLDKRRIYIKTLPKIEYLKKCKKRKFNNEKIIAVHDFISPEMLLCILKEFDIKYLIFNVERNFKKEDLSHIEAAIKYNIEVFIIKTLLLKYPVSFNDIDEILNYLLVL